MNHQKQVLVPSGVRFEHFDADFNIAKRGQEHLRGWRAVRICEASEGI